MSHRLSLLVGLLLIFDALSAQASDATVRVQVASGRTFHGIIDARTNGESLWLRSQVGEVQLQRPIAWERIVEAELNGEAIDIDELKSQSLNLGTLGRVAQLRTVTAESVSRPTQVSHSAGAVKSIRCNAWLANWDVDAEFDGLAVEIAAYDEFGRPMAAQGTVEAELISIDYQPGYLASTSGGRAPVSLGHWSQSWQSEQTLRLELQGRQPQHDGSLDRYALLRVRVTIPGSGVFERQIDGMRMRPFTPIGVMLWR